MPQFTPSLATRLALVVLSGLLTYPAIKLDSILTPDNYPPIFSWWMILHGLSFGALVMVPFVSARSYRGLRIAALIATSITSYYLAIEFSSLDDFAILTERVQFIIAGTTGAILVALATRFIAPLRIRTAYWYFIVLAGLVGGIIFSFTIEICFWEKCNAWWQVLPYTAGWIIWQGLVLLAMHFGTQRDSASRSGIEIAESTR
jgi:hypothetical protein